MTTLLIKNYINGDGNIIYKTQQINFLRQSMNNKYVGTWKYLPVVGKINILYPSINSGNMPIESSNLASLRTSSEVRLYLLKKYIYK